MGHYDCKECHAAVFQPHAPDCSQAPEQIDARAEQRKAERTGIAGEAIANTIARAEALEAEVARLRAALAPFAVKPTREEKGSLFKDPFRRMAEGPRMQALRAHQDKEDAEIMAARAALAASALIGGAE